MNWERLNDLAAALIEDGAVEFSLQRAKGAWWLHVHRCPSGSTEKFSLAWAAKESLADSFAAVEHQLTLESQKLLEKTRSATERLEAVLQGGVEKCT